MITTEYVYRGYVVSVYDGDTIRCHFDLGFGIKQNGLEGKGVALRLYGIDTPEMRGEELEQGRISRDYVRSKILEKNVIIQSIKDRTGKYGRYLAKIYYINEETGEQIYLNQELIDLGYAKEYLP